MLSALSLQFCQTGKCSEQDSCCAVVSCVYGSEAGFVAQCEGAEGGSGGRLQGQHYHHVMEDQRDGACSTHGILL